MHLNNFVDNGVKNVVFFNVEIYFIISHSLTGCTNIENGFHSSVGDVLLFFRNLTMFSANLRPILIKCALNSGQNFNFNFVFFITWTQSIKQRYRIETRFTFTIPTKLGKLFGRPGTSAIISARHGKVRTRGFPVSASPERVLVEMRPAFHTVDIFPVRAATVRPFLAADRGAFTCDPMTRPAHECAECNAARCGVHFPEVRVGRYATAALGQTDRGTDDADSRADS